MEFGLVIWIVTENASTVTFALQHRYLRCLRLNISYLKFIFLLASYCDARTFEIEIFHSYKVCLSYLVASNQVCIQPTLKKEKNVRRIVRRILEVDDAILLYD